MINIICLLNVETRLVTLRSSIHCPKKNSQISIINTFAPSDTFQKVLVSTSLDLDLRNDS